MTDMNFGQAIQEIGSIFKHLRASNPTRKLGITGFCLGGALSLAVAIAAESKPNACAPFYGIPDGKYFDVATITVPVLGQFGDKDTHTGFADLASALALGENLKKAGVDHEVRIVPDQGHGFMNENDWYTEYRKNKNIPPFNKDTVEEAYTKLFEFFDKHLKH